jgi:hypothetical protein
MRMNENHLFILCKKNSSLLRIFDLNTCDLVKELEVEADQMKLVSTTHLILFDSDKQVLFLYNQSDDFDKLEHVDLKPWLESEELNLSGCGTSSQILFYNQSCVKCTSFNNLFSSYL